ncbi:recombinase family protein [Klebsiella michiganensis]|uniref:recombinase family protein n=1 Tax=Klebsiella michiganensis TaxID=1134687 RepID=UPI001CCBCD06|nr:recombinase family protein [Klebsiella michiganensis]MBZ7392397.1 resolvase [Klebsiella michiganensis]MDL4446320.1 recombinase family protein [Klebsiella michiganensis]MDL4490884.1 recombinase family protein [Klebsiella michiganensis]MDL4659627.1 recombinase family protein [Klebsiella michiganensis]
MSSVVFGYLRASTNEQDAERAKSDLIKFASEHGLRSPIWHIENESGAKLERPELFRILESAQRGDVLLIEQVDRLSRLNADDWLNLRSTITEKGIRVVALDLPTSHMLAAHGDEFTGRMLDAINGMMLDMLAAIARKDYEDRRRRQKQGIDKAKAEGKYKGRGADLDKQAAIISLLKSGNSYSQIERAMGVSRPTIAKAAKVAKNAELKI